MSGGGARGLFVSFEGGDGAGKSTQLRRLAEALRAEGRDVVVTREPGGAPGAEEIRRLVLEGEPGRWSPVSELLLFNAARRDHVERTRPPAALTATDPIARLTRAYRRTRPPSESTSLSAIVNPASLRADRSAVR